MEVKYNVKLYYWNWIGLTDIIIGLPIIIIVAILKLKLDKYVESLKSEDDN